jgi:hypothetical protein
MKRMDHDLDGAGALDGLVASLEGDLRRELFEFALLLYVRQLAAEGIGAVRTGLTSACAAQTSTTIVPIASP